MVATTITIQSLEDSAAGKGFVDGATQEDIVMSKQFSVGILEKGTEGGQTSLMFCCKAEDGKVHVGQMTANQFEMLIGAFRGAVARFGK